MRHIIVNGKLLPAHSPVVESGNRGLRYGDGIFETMKWCQGNLVLAQDHFERLWNGLSLLQFDIPDHFTPQFLSREIAKLVEHEKLSYARVRLTVVRGNGGLFDLIDNDPFFFIEATALEKQETVTSEGVRIGVYRGAGKMCDLLSPIKHNNYLPYCMAAIFAKKNNFHDALLLNQFGRLCDSSMANIFFMNGERLITPALSEGCIAGIIRKNLVKILPQFGYTVEETMISEDMIPDFTSAFLTNSILNLKPISSINDHQLNPAPAFELKKMVAEKTNLFC